MLPRTSDGPVGLVMDSTGMKDLRRGGVGGPAARYSRRRTWPSSTWVCAPGTHEIQAAVVTEAGVTDGEAAPALLGRVDREVTAVGGDGRTTRRGCARPWRARAREAVIPPRKGARIKVHGNTKGEPDPRDVNLRGVRRLGRKGWKRKSGYHRRSLAETAMGRIKGIFGSGLRSREWLRQAAELGVRCRALNIMTHLGMPVTVKVV